MTRKEAIEELQFDLECGEFYNTAMKDSVEKAISDMKKMEQIENILNTRKVHPHSWRTSVEFLEIIKDIEQIVKGAEE